MTTPSKFRSRLSCGSFRPPAFIFGGVLSVRAAFPARADEPASAPEPADVAVGLVDTFHPRFCIDVSTSLIVRLKARHPQYRFRSEEQPPGKPVDPSKLGLTSSPP